MKFVLNRGSLFIVSFSILATTVLMGGCTSGKAVAPTQTITSTRPTTASTTAHGTAATTSILTTHSSVSTSSTSNTHETAVSDVVHSSSSYSGKTITLSGQTYLTSNGSGVLVDGTSGVNLIGRLDELEKGSTN